jgi:DNA-binding CsgD family transcriptional regulator
VPLRAPWCRIAIARGDIGLAGEQLAEMTAVPGAAGDEQFAPTLCGLRASLACRRGDFGAARLAAAEGLAVLDATDSVAGYLGLTAAAIGIEADELDAARASGLRSDPAAARAHAGEILAAAAAMTDRVVAAGGAMSPPFELLGAVAKAHLSRIPGPADPRLWQRIADDPLADRYLCGYASYQLATALLSLRTSRERAVTALRAAAAIAAGLGAQPLLAEIETLARHARIDLASGPPAPAAPDPLGLTPREREVITLLDHGMSNAQIASTLYVSEKTASVHVSNIMRKLGVTSRLQAAKVARSRS